MAVVSWRTDVNKCILDSTTITMGEGGLKEDSSDNGYKLRRATALASPVKYSVTMDFDWLEKDSDGNSEFDRFQTWYKYRHQYGTNPFWFPNISKFNINGTVTNSNGKTQMCQYIITSAPSFSKSGFCMRCTMTWEEVYTGIIAAEIPSLEYSAIQAENGLITLIATQELEEEPTIPGSGFVYGQIVDGTVSNYNSFTVFNMYASGKKACFEVDTISSGRYEIKADGTSLRTIVTF